jgi:hypothetical protein
MKAATVSNQLREQRKETTKTQKYQMDMVSNNKILILCFSDTFVKYSGGPIGTCNSNWHFRTINNVRVHYTKTGEFLLLSEDL